MLVPYGAYIYFPSGETASNYPIDVFLKGGNQLVSLFADDTGLIPASNPVTTNNFGLAHFWAAPGDYVSWLAENIFHYRVDTEFPSAVWPDLQIHSQSVVSSSWEINHYFGVSPAVTVVVEGTEIQSEVSHPTISTSIITFSDPITGVAYLRR